MRERKSWVMLRRPLRLKPPASRLVTQMRWARCSARRWMAWKRVAVGSRWERVWMEGFRAKKEATELWREVMPQSVKPLTELAEKLPTRWWLASRMAMAGMAFLVMRPMALRTEELCGAERGSLEKARDWAMVSVARRPRRMGKRLRICTMSDCVMSPTTVLSCGSVTSRRWCPSDIISMARYSESSERTSEGGCTVSQDRSISSPSDSPGSD